MAPRKKIPTVSLRPKTPKAMPAAPAPQASYGDWQSIGVTRARRAAYGAAPRDLRRDLTPYDRLTMVRKCRWAERNSGLFKQILADMVLYTVGDGIKPQSHASTPEMQERYEAYFAEKAKRIDITNRFSFYQAQAILLRGMIRDGDAFAAKVRNATGEAKLQLMEAHRVGDPLDGEPPEGMHDGIQFGGDALVPLRRRYRILADVLVGHRDRVVTAERSAPGEELEEQTPRGVQVRAGVDTSPLSLLGGEVLVLARDDARGLDHAGEAVAARADREGAAEVAAFLGAGLHVEARASVQPAFVRLLLVGVAFPGVFRERRLPASRGGDDSRQPRHAGHRPECAASAVRFSL